VEDASAGSITCQPWEKGSQVKVESIDVGTCICANECLAVPKNHYYYNDPINKTRQTNEQEITLPVVLAWDNVDGWTNEEGGYLWQLGGLGGERSVNSKLFGARSYLLEIENKNLELNDSKSAGSIFRQVLKEKAIELKEKGVETYEETKQRAETAYKDAIAKADELAKVAKEKAAEISRSAKVKVEKVADDAAEAVE